MATSCIDLMEKNNLKESLHPLTWHDLHHGDRSVAVPFSLALNDSEDVLICDEVVRLLPGKRLVAMGTLGDKQVVAKLFYDGGKAKRHIKREIDGIDILKASGTPSPNVVWQGTALKRKVQVLIFERILDCISLDEIWHTKNYSDDLLELMQNVTIELATQHVLGVVQDDLHLNNFLVTEKHIYTLDGGSVHQVEGILPKEESLDHLALFFAQLGVGTESLHEILFQIYVKARGWIIKKNDLEFLKTATRRWVQKRAQRFEKKLQRSSTAFARIVTSKSLLMYDREYQSDALDYFLLNPDKIIQQSDTQLIKAGRSATVAKIKIDNRYFIVKRYNIKSTAHWLRRCLRMTRAVKTWQLALRLNLFGIDTAKPVAFIENQFLALRGRSYLLMECIEGPHAGEYFANYCGGDVVMDEMAKQIVTLISNLAKLNLTHGDLKATNILIANNKPVLIDLDGMKEHKSKLSLKLAVKKDWSRFLKNWGNSPSVLALFRELIDRQ